MSEISCRPFGLGKSLKALKGELGAPLLGSALLLPAGPTFQEGNYFVSFGFLDPDGLAELIYIYRVDGQQLSDQEVFTLLEANKDTKSTGWAPCGSLPSATLNILRKASFRSYPDEGWWALHIASKKSPPAFQPALLIMSDSFLKGIVNDMP